MLCFNKAAVVNENGCKLGTAGYTETSGQFPAMSVVIKPGILSQKLFSFPNSNQVVSDKTLRHETCQRIHLSDTDAVSVSFFVHGFKISRRISQAGCEVSEPAGLKCSELSACRKMKIQQRQLCHLAVRQLKLN